MSGFLKRAIWRAALITLMVCAGYLTGHAYLLNQPLSFYAAFIVLALLLATATKLGWNQQRLPQTLAGTFLIFTVFLPVADFVYLKMLNIDGTPSEIKLVYSFRAAKGDPKAFYAFWKYYTDQWKEVRKAITREPDPKGILPFIYVPNSTGKFFNSEMHINNLGFRGNDFPAEKGNHYRIFALGESPTFAGTLYPDDLPWPDVLQRLIDSRLKCDRPIQVINAGAAAYNLRDNLERLRRDTLPLGPDIIISYHAFNGLDFLDTSLSRYAEPPIRTPRASALLGEAEYRLRHLRFRVLEDHQIELLDAVPMDSLLKSTYANLYRELIDLGAKYHFMVVLTNASMAVTAESPEEVKDFYSYSYYNQIRTMIAMVAEHNRMVKEIAARAEVPFIDTTPGIAGNWDSDLFLDPVHFTQKGSNLFAKRILDGLEPLLLSNQSIQCTVAP